MELSERCIQTLEKEGYPSIFEVKDKPGAVRVQQHHDGKVTIFVTEGTLELTQVEAVHILVAGDRFNVPAKVPYSTTSGSKGCQYVIGEMV